MLHVSVTMASFRSPQLDPRTTSLPIFGLAEDSEKIGHVALSTIYYMVYFSSLFNSHLLHYLKKTHGLLGKNKK